MKRKPPKRVRPKLVSIPTDTDRRRDDCKLLLSTWYHDADADGLVTVVAVGLHANGKIMCGFMGVKDRLQVLGALEHAKAALLETE